MDIADLIKAIPALRWRNIQQRYGIDFEHIEDDPIVSLIIAANEMARPQNNDRDQFERFEAMPLVELVDWIDQNKTTDTAAEGADKS